MFKARRRVRGGARPAGITRLEREVADAFRSAAGVFRSAWKASIIRDILRNGSVDVLIGSAPLGRISDLLSPLVDPLRRASTTAGVASISASFQYRFDVTDPRTLAYAEAQAARLVTAVTDSTREAIRQTVADSFVYQRSVDQTARALQDVVGVTGRGAAQLTGAYERSMIEAIGRGATEAEARLFAAQTTGALRERLVESRARTIARTEILRAENSGRYLGWAQGVEAGEIDGESKKEWISGDCPICSELDGEVVAWDAPFSLGVDMPPAHPNCVCTAVILPADTPLSRSDTATDPDAVAIEEEIGSPLDA